MMIVFPKLKGGGGGLMLFVIIFMFYCSSPLPSSTLDFVKNSPCGNAVVKEGMKCLDDYRRQLYAAASLPKGDKDKIMRIMCW